MLLQLELKNIGSLSIISSILIFILSILLIFVIFVTFVTKLHFDFFSLFSYNWILVTFLLITSSGDIRQAFVLRQL